ncbi:MAG: hypothetical protein M1834_003482 [Cirrosporium novae-zelandiae]|nr:MAG: hypothetical protein M1834_003482 [Cirrosporium novae-zelandiae]
MADQLHGYQTRLNECKTLLRDLSSRVDAHDRSRIQMVLDRLPVENITSNPHTRSISVPDIVSPQERPSGSESHRVTASIDSFSVLDSITEDYDTNETLRATGFTGKHSERVWVDGQQKETSSKESASTRDVLEPISTSEMYSPRPMLVPRGNTSQEGFWMDDSDYNVNDITIEIPDEVDPYTVPPKEVAEDLVNSYMETLTSFYRGVQVRPSAKWCAILNLIFAIGAQHHSLKRSEGIENIRYHRIYFKKARLLALTNETIMEHPDFQQIQIVALASFYLLSANQVNR